MHVSPATHIQPLQTSGIELMGKVPLQSLAPLGLQALPPFGSNPSSIPVHRRLLRRARLPVPHAALRLGDVASQSPLRYGSQHGIAVVAFVGYYFLDSLEVHRFLDHLLGHRCAR